MPSLLQHRPLPPPPSDNNPDDDNDEEDDDNGNDEDDEDDDDGNDEDDEDDDDDSDEEGKDDSDDDGEDDSDEEDEDDSDDDGDDDAENYDSDGDYIHEYDSDGNFRVNYDANDDDSNNLDDVDVQSYDSEGNCKHCNVTKDNSNNDDNKADENDNDKADEDDDNEDNDDEDDDEDDDYDDDDEDHNRDKDNDDDSDDDSYKAAYLLECLRTQLSIVRRLIVVLGPHFQVSYSPISRPDFCVITTLQDCIGLPVVFCRFRLVDLPSEEKLTFLRQDFLLEGFRLGLYLMALMSSCLKIKKNVTNAQRSIGLVFSNLPPIVNALGVSRITSCVSLKILVSHIVSNAIITPLNSTTSSYLFFVKNKVAGMICCLNMMARRRIQYR